MGKLFIIIGLLLALIGVLLILKIPIPFGKLPGDFVYKGEHFQFYFPLATCILLSVIFSLLYYLFGKS